jgi:HD superfamily phosphohydrolase YqeK
MLLVKEAFFLRENIEIIQNAIIRNVAKKSKYLISRQKEDDIILLMNGIYHDYSRNLPYDLKEQILDLNDRVKRILEPRIAEFLQWKEISEQELRKRFNIEKNYF